MEKQVAAVAPVDSRTPSKKDLKIKGDTLNARKHLRFKNYRGGIAEYCKRTDYPEGVKIIGVEKGGECGRVTGNGRLVFFLLLLLSSNLPS
jgi:hypothetical protein